MMMHIDKVITFSILLNQSDNISSMSIYYINSVEIF
jgi:hypothetical protein